MVWLTEIEAIDPSDGELKKWAGINVVADTIIKAREYLDKNGFGYCKIIGILELEIEIEDTFIILN